MDFISIICQRWKNLYHSHICPGTHHYASKQHRTRKKNTHHFQKLQPWLQQILSGFGGKKVCSNTVMLNKVLNNGMTQQKQFSFIIIWIGQSDDFVLSIPVNNDMKWPLVSWSPPKQCCFSRICKGAYQITWRWVALMIQSLLPLSPFPPTEMNRHHYSLYVHNCRLVFLLRRDFTQVDTFRPAEFHWKLEQVRCWDTLERIWQRGEHMRNTT